MERALLVAACLLRSIAHQFRNDLAILQNELTYLKTLAPAGECDRAFEVLKELGSSLKISDLISSGKLDLEEHAVSSILESLRQAGAVEKSSASVADIGQILCDLPRLTSSLGALCQLVDSLSKSPSDLAPVEFSAVSGGNELNFTLMKVVRRVPEWLDISGARHHSFSSFVLQTLKIDSIWAALSDAILWAHGAESEITLRHSGELSLVITLPLKK